MLPRMHISNLAKLPRDTHDTAHWQKKKDRILKTHQSSCQWQLKNTNSARVACKYHPYGCRSASATYWKKKYVIPKKLSLCLSVTIKKNSRSIKIPKNVSELYPCRRLLSTFAGKQAGTPQQAVWRAPLAYIQFRAGPGHQLGAPAAQVRATSM